MLHHVIRCNAEIYDNRTRYNRLDIRCNSIYDAQQILQLEKTVQYDGIPCNMVRYIPLISRVRGPYGKLWTEFFPSFYGPSAKRAGHENKEGKNEDP